MQSVLFGGSLFAKGASAMAGISPLRSKYTVFKLDKITANLMELLCFSSDTPEML
jgi:hypothetical protein